MAAKDKKYYWLRLKRDFFKRHDIRIIEAMPNGKDYILFYLKLLCESVDHEGNLRFSEEIPYNEQMLSTITNTNVDVVKSAIKIFTELNMMEIMDDGTYYMREVEKMLGSETYWAKVKREQRDREEAEILPDNEGQRYLPESGESEQLEMPEANSRGGYSSEFEELWQSYPRKNEKAGAYKAYKARLNDGYSHEELQTAVKNYAMECSRLHTAARYIKHAKTFFGPNMPFVDYLPKGLNAVRDQQPADDNPFAEY